MIINDGGRCQYIELYCRQRPALPVSVWDVSNSGDLPYARTVTKQKGDHHRSLLSVSAAAFARLSCGIFDESRPRRWNYVIGRHEQSRRKLFQLVRKKDFGRKAMLADRGLFDNHFFLRA